MKRFKLWVVRRWWKLLSTEELADELERRKINKDFETFYAYLINLYHETWSVFPTPPLKTPKTKGEK